MASYEVDYNNLGKGLDFDGTKWYFFGDDFNPSQPSGILQASECKAYDITTNYDLSGFQPGHEVLGYTYDVIQYGPSSELNLSVHMDFLRSSDGSSWETGWYENVTDYWDSIPSGDWQWKWRYWYAGVDYDEIRSGYTYYKFHVYSANREYDFFSPTFTVSNLNIDSSTHPSGRIWVDGNHLCYTDASYTSTRGFKHKIAYDGNYNSYVGTEYSGMMWLDPTTSRKIYYVDEYGYKRRTYAARDWYGGSVSPGTSKSGAMWVSNGGYSSGGVHLCFISSAGDKLRILNGPPAGVT